jgi:tetratricopeptide (TPR) repeat protein
VPILLAALVDKSLVAAHEAPDGASRYRLLHTVRQYASAKLVESGEADDLLGRHARHLLWLAAASADAVHGPDADTWMRRMEEAHADLGAALAWTKQTDPELCLRLAAASALFWEDRGYLTEGRRWLDLVLGLADVPSSIQAAAWIADGRLALLQNDLLSAQARLKRGLAAADLAKDEAQVASMLRMLGLVAAQTGDRASAVRCQQQSLEIVERRADNEELANTLHTLGQTARVLGNQQDAHAYHTRCLGVARALRNHRLAALANLNLGTLALRWGDLDVAEKHIRESLGIWSWLGGRLQAAAAVTAVALVTAERGDYDQALRIVSAAAAFAQQIGTSLERTARFWFGDDLAARVELIRGRLGPVAAAVAWDQGHALTLEEAIRQTLARAAVGV